MSIAQITVQELKDELARTKVTRGIQEVVLHHTWSPSAVQYAGKSTWEAIRNYHMKERGWSDIGYHYGVGPDGSVWRLRPVTRSGAHVLNRNQHTIGVAMVGNFDVEDPARYGLPTAVEVVRVLVERFKLGLGAIRFHREFADKTCPGKRLDLTKFRLMVERQTQAANPPTKTVKLVDHETGKVIGSLEMVSGGDHIGDQGKLYVKGRPKVG